MLPEGINSGGKINGKSEGVGSWLAGSWPKQRLLPQGRVPIRASHALIGSAGSLSSVPGEISALALSGQQLTSSPGQSLVLSVLYGPTPNHTVLRPAAWSHVLPHGPAADCEVPLPTAWSCTKPCGAAACCTILHQTLSSCGPLCGPESHCTVGQPTTLSCTPSHDPAPRHVVWYPCCVVLHPITQPCTPSHSPAPHHTALHPTAWSCTPSHLAQHPPARPEQPLAIHPPLAGKPWWLEQLHVLFIL